MAETKLKIPNVKPTLQPLLAIRQGWANLLHSACSILQDSLDRAKTFVNQLEDRVRAVEDPLSRVVIKRFFVNGDLEVPYPGEPVDTIFLYAFEMDSVGGHTITLPPQFRVFGNSGRNLNNFNHPDTISTFMVYKREDGQLIGSMVATYGSDGIGESLMRRLLLQNDPTNPFHGSGAELNILSSADNSDRVALGIDSNDGGVFSLVFPLSGCVIGFGFAPNGGPGLTMNAPGVLQGVVLNVGDGSQLQQLISTGEALQMIGIGTITPFDANRDLGSGLAPFRNAHLNGALLIDDVQVLKEQGAAVADATDATDVITQLNTLLARLRDHGLIAT